ncbi:MAG: hypothetical protein ATN31_01725 [Candidatus Epulonipiscioides saccharophilum]|nr:MAG: hypothetical protein ATN31_01725 [Epulopiscium sp. AS2M-Bin001]
MPANTDSKLNKLINIVSKMVYLEELRCAILAVISGTVLMLIIFYVFKIPKTIDINDYRYTIVTEYMMAMRRISELQKLTFRKKARIYAVYYLYCMESVKSLKSVDCVICKNAVVSNKNLLSGHRNDQYGNDMDKPKIPTNVIGINYTTFNWYPEILVGVRVPQG